jgi:hypothetical protein
MSLRRVLTMALLIPTAAMAHTVRIPTDQPTIQTGIAAAVAGDTVLVAGGSYFEHDILLKSGVTLRGAPEAAGTVEVNGMQQGRVIDCNNVQNAVIENLVIVGGEKLTVVWLEDAGAGVRCLNASVRISDCRFANNRASVGGGLGILASSVIVERCEFADNQARHAEWTCGGGIFSRGSSGVVRDCTFTGNTAFSVGLPGDGGGLFTDGSYLEISDCTFRDNATGAGGGGFYSFRQDNSRVADCDFVENTAAWGGAAYLEQSRATLTRCTFTSNSSSSGAGAIETVRANNVFRDCEFIANTTAAYDGGALQSYESTLTLDGCLFRGNTAPSGGGAILLGGVNAVLRDCVFQNNVGPLGGAIRCHYSTPELTGCTFVGNRATVGGGALYLGTASGAVLEHCIIAFSPQGASIGGIAAVPVTLTFCDIYGNVGGDWVPGIADQLGQDGNLSAAPLFCGIADGNLHLDAASPCAASNNPNFALIGALPVGCQVIGVPDIGTVGAVVMTPAVPNPFNPSTTIHFALALPALTRVIIVDVAGRLVRTLSSEPLLAGDHQVAWDGRDAAGSPVAAGVYHAVVTSGAQRASIRLALIK